MDIEPQNIALTNGGQEARFSTYLISSPDVAPTYQYENFPLAPEYIGYADSGLKTTSSFRRARICVDFDICTSARKSGDDLRLAPTSNRNVITDEKELMKLDGLESAQHPLSD